MLNLTPRKIASIVTSVGIVALVLLLIITCAHAGLAHGTPANPDGLAGEYFSATIALAVISVLMIIGGIVYRKVTKNNGDEANNRDAVEELLNTGDLNSMNHQKTT